MENEILEYIDEVRIEYPEVVAEDEPINIQSDPDIEESYIYQEPEMSVLAISENKIGNFGELKIMGVIDSANKSDVLILNSDASDNRSGGEVFDLTNFDSTVLWTNGNTSVNFNAQYVGIIGNISDYDYFGVDFLPLKGTGEHTTVLIPVSDLKAITNNRFALGCIISGRYYSRYVQYINDNQIYISPCYLGSDQINNLCIPVNLIGYKYQTISDGGGEVINPSVSGNIINNNNYYICLSDNSVSNNIMTKNINDYTVGESLSLMIFLGLLVAGMVYTIKKSIFKW